MLHHQEYNGIVVLRLDHGKANALDIELCDALVETLGIAGDSARAVVLTGGGNIFSAGVDLVRVLEDGAEYVERFLETLKVFCEAIFTFPRPLVAAINGHAIAGGCVLAAMADRRLMAAGSGRIGVPELLVGLPFPAGPLEIMRLVVGSRYLSEVMYGGATYEPADALERGLVDAVVPASELVDRAVDTAEALGRVSSEAFRLTKLQIRHPIVDVMHANEAALGGDVRGAWTDAGTLDAIRDYVQRTFKANR